MSVAARKPSGNGPIVLVEVDAPRARTAGWVDIYVQHNKPSKPTQASNWLPAPAPGLGFRLVWRLYDLEHAVFGVLDGSGWQPPPVQPCDTTGHTPNGTACAT